MDEIFENMENLRAEERMIRQQQGEMSQISERLEGLNMEGAAKVQAGNEEINKAFTQAAEAGHLEEMLQLLSKGADVLYKDCHYMTALDYAICRSDVELVKALIAHGALDISNAGSGSPLFLAAACGHKGVLDALICAGASPLVYDDNDETPLHVAATDGNVECLAALVAAGADINARDKLYGNTALHEAALRNHDDCVETLVDLGANVNQQNSFGDTPLHCTSLLDNPRIVTILVQARVNLNLRNNEGNTALHKLAHLGAVECVQELLNVGANPSIRNKKGQTAIDLAKKPAIRAMLLEYYR